MKQLVSEAIVLNRTDYGEADRIVRLLTPDHGKLSLMAKGVRRIKSKMAGGIELFCVSEITFIKGRGEVGTLVSARLKDHYACIVGDLERSMLGFELIKKLNRVTEDQAEEEYFTLLSNSFAALNDRELSPQLIRFWFMAQLIRLSGHTPNLYTDSSGDKLVADRVYNFSFDDMVLTVSPARGQLTSAHIKFLRLVMAGNSPRVLAHITSSTELLDTVSPLVNTMINVLLRV